MTQTARGSFELTLQPLTFEGLESQAQFGRLLIDKQISGDLVATTSGQMLSARTDTNGSAGYVAIERVSGALDGREGSFVLLHTGLLNRGASSLSVVVVPDSGTGELTGIEGRFEIIIENGKHRYEFVYQLP